MGLPEVASNGRSFTVVPPTGAAAGCTSQPGTVIYRQNWANGVAPNAMPNTPYSPGTLYYQNTAWGGGDPIDPIYPEIASSESVTVLTGGGPNGENVLDFNPAGTPYGEEKRDGHRRRGERRVRWLAAGVLEWNADLRLQ